MYRLWMMVVSVFLLWSCAQNEPKSDVVAPTPAPTSAPKPASVKVATPKATATPAVVDQKTANHGIDSSEFQSELNDQSWKLVSDENGVKTFSKKTQATDVVSFRGETMIPASIAKIATVLNTDSLRKEWVDALVEASTVQQINKLERIEYNHSKVPWPFQDRDFLYHVDVFLKKSPNAMLIKLKSIKDDRVPPKDGIVRGEIEHAYYYMTAIDGVRATHVIVEMALDPKGAIPLWLMNAVQKNWPYKTLQSLRKISQREDIQTSPEIRDFFSKGGE